MYPECVHFWASPTLFWATFISHLDHCNDFLNGLLVYIFFFLSSHYTAAKVMVLERKSHMSIKKGRKRKNWASGISCLRVEAWVFIRLTRPCKNWLSITLESHFQFPHPHLPCPKLLGSQTSLPCASQFPLRTSAYNGRCPSPRYHPGLAPWLPWDSLQKSPSQQGLSCPPYLLFQLPSPILISP